MVMARAQPGAHICDGSNADLNRDKCTQRPQKGNVQKMEPSMSSLTQVLPP